MRWTVAEQSPFRELGVGYVLEGSARKAGSHVRINVQLIDSGSDFQVWAEDFVGELKNVISLQDGDRSPNVAKCLLICRGR